MTPDIDTPPSTVPDLDDAYLQYLEDQLEAAEQALVRDYEAATGAALVALGKSLPEPPEGWMIRDWQSAVQAKLIRLALTENSVSDFI